MKDSKGSLIIYILIILVVCIFLVLLPLVINHIYYLEAPSKFFITDLNVADFVVYYASALSFLGSLILGVLTLHQNKRAQEKTDEINKLQLEMQKRSMELAERQYKKETESSIPKFNISILGYSGHYLNPRIKVKNVSSMLISDLTFISSYVKDGQENIIRKVTDHQHILSYSEYLKWHENNAYYTFRLHMKIRAQNLHSHKIDSLYLQCASKDSTFLNQ